MNIGTLELKAGNNGPYYVATNIDFVGVPKGIAMQANPKRAEHENAADFILRVLVGREWKTAGSASWREAKSTGVKYVNGAIQTGPRDKVFLNFYPNDMDDAGDAESFDVVFASGGGRRRASADMTGGRGAQADLGDDQVPF